jgi:hypothetical protein
VRDCRDTLVPPPNDPDMGSALCECGHTYDEHDITPGENPPCTSCRFEKRYGTSLRDR